MKVVKKQTNSKLCYICGIENGFGLKASFYEMEDGSVISIFKYKEITKVIRKEYMVDLSLQC